MKEQQTCSTYLEPSYLLDYRDPTIDHLVSSKGWNVEIANEELIREIYTYVRDEIAYGYTKSFATPASGVLAEKQGNSITKSILFMALLRSRGIPCRFYAMTKSTVIFRGLLPGFRYKLARRHPYCAMVEILYKDKWVAVEGHIIDKPYIQNVQHKYPLHKRSFYGYGIATLDFYNLDKEWDVSSVIMQSRVIKRDLGPFNTPDTFFSQVPQAEGYAQSLIYKAFTRPRLNRSIQKMRNGL